ncbi:MAG: hypothetical protein FGM26_06925 [Beijerinckiaceae bacterium]|nr:hypothetical protein [Beijerinckiaceae bacterium]
MYDRSFGGVGFEKSTRRFVTGETGPAAVLMFGGDIQWKSRQGLLIGGEWAYVKTQSPATPYTLYGAGLITRIRIERGF